MTTLAIFPNWPKKSDDRIIYILWSIPNVIIHVPKSLPLLLLVWDEDQSHKQDSFAPHAYWQDVVDWQLPCLFAVVPFPSFLAWYVQSYIIMIRDNVYHEYIILYSLISTDRFEFCHLFRVFSSTSKVVSSHGAYVYRELLLLLAMQDIVHSSFLEYGANRNDRSKEKIQCYSLVVCLMPLFRSCLSTLYLVATCTRPKIPIGNVKFLHAKGTLVVFFIRVEHGVK